MQSGWSGQKHAAPNQSSLSTGIECESCIGWTTVGNRCCVMEKTPSRRNGMHIQTLIDEQSAPPSRAEAKMTSLSPCKQERRGSLAGAMRTVDRWMTAGAPFRGCHQQGEHYASPTDMHEYGCLPHHFSLSLKSRQGPSLAILS